MIPLVAPTITGHDRAYVHGAIDDGALTNNLEVRRFEEDFASYVAADDAIAVSSGTAALRVAIDTLGVRIVSLPSYACEALRHATSDRARRYVDSTYDVPTATITQEPATVAVAMFGNRHNLTTSPSIEDWTLSLGYPHAIPEGALGVCSTHATKMISTGRGGLIYGRDTTLLAEARAAAERAGVTMSASQAALGRSQLRQLPTFISRRREIAAGYTDRFTAAGIECPDPACGSVFFRYIIRVTVDPAVAVAKLAARGIEAGRGVYPPLHRLARLKDDRFPGATRNVNTLLSVPCHPSLTDQQVGYIADTVAMVCAP